MKRVKKHANIYHQTTNMDVHPNKKTQGNASSGVPKQEVVHQEQRTAMHQHANEFWVDMVHRKGNHMGNAYTVWTIMICAHNKIEAIHCDISPHVHGWFNLHSELVTVSLVFTVFPSSLRFDQRLEIPGTPKPWILTAEFQNNKTCWISMLANNSIVFINLSGKNTLCIDEIWISCLVAPPTRCLGYIPRCKCGPKLVSLTHIHTRISIYIYIDM